MSEVAANETSKKPKTAAANLAEALTLLPPGSGEVSLIDTASFTLKEGVLPKVPGFLLESELGRGGMGVVYLARQCRLNRLVALKMIISGEHACHMTRQRFLAEAEAIARVQHPGIVQVYEFGMHDNRPYYALEYVGGGSLDKKLSGTPLHPMEAADLVQKLAWAVQAAHDRGVIHRDLKPANILLCDDSTTGSASHKKLGAGNTHLSALFPKITDFGLVKQPGSEMTVTGHIMGTPSYMAPEQADCKKEVGPTVDVYALGAILYECLTGRPPFKAATHLDTVLQVVNDEPVNVRQLQPKTPRGLELICMKCLQKQPGKRYASAQLLAEDLGRCLAGEPVHARPPHMLPRTWEWFRRHPWALVNVFVIVLAILISTTYGFWARSVEAHWRQLIAEAKVERMEKRPLMAFAKLGQASQLHVEPQLYDEAVEIIKPNVATQIDPGGEAAARLIDANGSRADRERKGQESPWKEMMDPPPSLAAHSTDGKRIALLGDHADSLMLVDAQTREVRDLKPTPFQPQSWHEQVHHSDRLQLGKDVVFTRDGRYVAAFLYPTDSRPTRYYVVVWDTEEGSEYLRLPVTGMGELFAGKEGGLAISAPDSPTVLWQLEPLHARLSQQGALGWMHALPENESADYIPSFIDRAAQWVERHTMVPYRIVTLALFFLPFCAAYVLGRQFALCRLHARLPTTTHLVIGMMVGMLAVGVGFLYLFTYFNTLGGNWKALISSVSFYIWFFGCIFAGTRLLVQTANAYRVAEFGDEWKEVTLLGLQKATGPSFPILHSLLVNKLSTPFLYACLGGLLLMIVLVHLTGSVQLTRIGNLIFLIGILACLGILYYQRIQTRTTINPEQERVIWWRTLGFRKPVLPWSILLILIMGGIWLAALAMGVSAQDAWWVALVIMAVSMGWIGIAYLSVRFLMSMNRSSHYLDRMVDHSLTKINRWDEQKTS